MPFYYIFFHENTLTATILSNTMLILGKVQKKQKKNNLMKLRVSFPFFPPILISEPMLNTFI